MFWLWLDSIWAQAAILGIASAVGVAIRFWFDPPLLWPDVWRHVAAAVVFSAVLVPAIASLLRRALDDEAGIVQIVGALAFLSGYHGRAFLERAARMIDKRVG